MATVAVGVGLGLGCVVAVGAEVGCVVAVGVGVVVVPVPPQAANRKATMIANGRNPQDARLRLANDKRFVCMFGTSSHFNGASPTNIQQYM